MRIKKLSTSPQRLRTNSTGSAYCNQKVLTVQWREKKRRGLEYLFDFLSCTDENLEMFHLFFQGLNHLQSHPRGYTIL